MRSLAVKIKSTPELTSESVSSERNKGCMLRVGVFFGGQSREREISFSGAKTVFSCADRTLFELVPIFADSFGNFVLLNEDFLNKPNIRAFYPPKKHAEGKSFEGFSVYAESIGDRFEPLALASEIGTVLPAHELKKHIDFAFLILHGTYSEDGTLQGLLEFLNIPYSGCGVYASAVSINKHLQKRILNKHCRLKKYGVLRKEDWLKGNRSEIFENLKREYGLPLVLKAPYQGSSIGVSILKKDDLKMFAEAVNTAFFLKEIEKSEWLNFTESDKRLWVQNLIDLDKGIGLPVIFFEKSMMTGNLGDFIIHAPNDLIAKLDDYFSYSDKTATLTSFDSEEIILIEQFIDGIEFSCGVMRTPEGKAVALPPTEIIAPSQNYDFEAKYAPGGSRKVLPVRASDEINAKIQQTVEAVFEDFDCNVYARIDGFVEKNGEIIIIDTNNIPGMSPTSLIFRQAAEVGLNPTQLLSFIVLQSLRERAYSGKRPYHCRHAHDLLAKKIETNKHKLLPYRLLVLHESSDDAALSNVRNEYNEIYAKGKERPLPVFVSSANEIFILPVAFLLRATIRELTEDLSKPVHAIIEASVRRTNEVCKIFNLEFSPCPLRISEEDLREKGCDVSSVFVNRSENV